MSDQLEALRDALERLDEEPAPKGELTSLSAYVVRLCDVAVAARAAVLASGDTPQPKPLAAVDLGITSDDLRVAAVYAPSMGLTHRLVRSADLLEDEAAAVLGPVDQPDEEGQR